MGINSSSHESTVIPSPQAAAPKTAIPEVAVPDSTEPLASPFACKDAPIENHRPLKVRVIGAGYSGVYMGIRIPQRLRNIDLKIYEKNEGIGGTWWENRYPGCACDIPCEFRPQRSSSLLETNDGCCQRTHTSIPLPRTRTGPASTPLRRRSASISRALRRSLGPLVSSTSSIRSRAQSGTRRRRSGESVFTHVGGDPD